MTLFNGTTAYKKMIEGLETAFVHSQSVQFGVRLEVVCSVQAADYILQQGPMPILETLLKYDTLISLNTKDIMEYKLLVLTGLHTMVQRAWGLRCPNLPRGRIRLLQYILYCIKSLASRPDDGGSYSEFAEQLDLSNAITSFNRPVLDENVFDFDSALLNVERELKVDGLYDRHCRKRQLEEGDAIDEQDPRSAPRQPPPLSNEEAIRRIIKQFCLDFYTTLPKHYVAVHQVLKEPPNGFRKEQIEGYLSSVDYRNGNYLKKFAMLFFARCTTQWQLEESELLEAD